MFGIKVILGQEWAVFSEFAVILGRESFDSEDLFAILEIYLRI
ncbi:hypothetical protein [Bacillus sp. Y1]|nr:hypothetical protein [Bacillus sp. Y1]